MFRLPPALGSETVEVFVQDRPVRVPVNATAAAAALMAGLTTTRTSPVTGEPRAPYCMMGVCFECLLVIDGQSSRQGCMVQVRPGMRIERQAGARTL